MGSVTQPIGAPMMLVLLVILTAFGHTRAQFGSGNANDFVDSMLADALRKGDNSLSLEDEKLIVVVDLLLFSPKLQLELRDGVLNGLNSLSRSSDALVSYDESSGVPVFTVTSSLLLSNVSMLSAAQGRVEGLGFGLTMPNIKLKVKVEAVDVGAIIDLPLEDLTKIRPIVREVEFKDVGHIDVAISGLSPELDSMVSPITTLIANRVKKDIQNLVTPLIKETLQDVVAENVPEDITQLFG